MESLNRHCDYPSANTSLATSASESGSKTPIVVHIAVTNFQPKYPSTRKVWKPYGVVAKECIGHGIASYPAIPWLTRCLLEGMCSVLLFVVLDADVSLKEYYGQFPSVPR
jgi:hypothetical protein